MSQASVSPAPPIHPAAVAVKTRGALYQLTERKALPGAISIIGFLVVWQLSITWELPYLSNIPYPKDVWDSLHESVLKSSYWNDWKMSLIRVFVGFTIGQVVGIPLGLAMGASKTIKALCFPVFEMLRPIPPIAWIPLSILFWPTEELSIYFLTFIGAFFVIVLNVMQGVSSIDLSVKRAAISLGASRKDIFFKIMIPGSLPSIVTGMTVGIGVTWNVLIAAEMIAGHGGLGRGTWEAYTNGNLPLILVGMVSIGLAGYITSSLVRVIGEKAMPWRRKF